MAKKKEKVDNKKDKPTAQEEAKKELERLRKRDSAVWYDDKWWE